MSVEPHELVQSLLQRHTDELRANEARAEQIRAEVEGFVAAETSAGRVRAAWLVGSLAWGGWGTHSDVDLVVEGLKEEDAAGVWDRLGHAVGVRSDLLRIESLPPAFAARVRAEGVALHVP